MAKTKINNLILFGKILTLVLLVACADLAMAIPQQGISIALASASYTKTTISKNYGGSLPMGFAGEYSLFMGPSLCLAGQFEINLEPVEQSAVLIGGSGGIKYHFIGGINQTISDTYIQGQSWPQFGAYLAVGLGGKQFDFSVPEKKEDLKSEGLIVQKDAKDLPKGSTVGLSLGLGLDYPLSSSFNTGLRFQLFKGLSSATQPDIQSTSIWIAFGFII